MKLDSKYYYQLINSWVNIEGPKVVSHNFTFMPGAVLVPVVLGKQRLSVWMCYICMSHPDEITITPLEPPIP